MTHRRPGGRLRTPGRRGGRRRASARAHGADPSARGLDERSRSRLQEPRVGPASGRLRARRGHRAARLGDQAIASGPAGRREAHRFFSPDRADGRRQDRGRQAARKSDGHRLSPLRHERVHGGAHGLAAHRRAAWLRRVRPGRPPDRRDREDAARRAPPRRDREGAPADLQHPAAGHGPRTAHRPQRQADRLSPRQCS